MYIRYKWFLIYRILLLYIAKVLSPPPKPGRQTWKLENKIIHLQGLPLTNPTFLPHRNPHVGLIFSPIINLDLNLTSFPGKKKYFSKFIEFLIIFFNQKKIGLSEELQKWWECPRQPVPLAQLLIGAALPPCRTVQWRTLRNGSLYSQPLQS